MGPEKERYQGPGQEIDHLGDLPRDETLRRYPEGSREMLDRHSVEPEEDDCLTVKIYLGSDESDEKKPWYRSVIDFFIG
ncbi:MAG: hypothetical protein ISS36_01055 [Candidatus Aenigmarchaeota archaeon]|nr:hypothetical protein [Candidatus Aenigmarchaeota archaeon]